MKEYSYEWFLQQSRQNSQSIRTEWPDWMKETAAFSTASFPTAPSRKAMPDDKSAESSKPSQEDGPEFSDKK